SENTKGRNHRAPFAMGSQLAQPPTPPSVVPFPRSRGKIQAPCAASWFQLANLFRISRMRELVCCAHWRGMILVSGKVAELRRRSRGIGAGHGEEGEFLGVFEKIVNPVPIRQSARRRKM